MSAREREAIGVECAWVATSDASPPSRLLLGALALVLTLGAWEVLDGLWSYVLLAFFS